jgi:hypothetical protein
VSEASQVETESIVSTSNLSSAATSIGGDQVIKPRSKRMRRRKSATSVIREARKNPIMIGASLVGHDGKTFWISHGKTTYALDDDVAVPLVDSHLGKRYSRRFADAFMNVDDIFEEHWGRDLLYQPDNLIEESYSIL